MLIYNASCSISKSYDQLIALDNSSCHQVLSKTVTLHPSTGHPNKFISFNDDVCINRLGCPNPGINYYRQMNQLKKPFLLSIHPECTSYDFSKFSKLDGLEINVSCPNLNENTFGFDLEAKTEGTYLRFSHKDWPLDNDHFKHSSF